MKAMQSASLEEKKVKIIACVLGFLVMSVASAQTAYQLPTTKELIGYQCSNPVQFEVLSNDGTTQAGLVFAEGCQGARGPIWANAARATAAWEESGNLLGYQVTKTETLRNPKVPSSWCFG